MAAGPRRDEPPFWTPVVVRLVAIFVAGLALIVFFKEVMVPILRSDVEQHQRKHQPAADK